MKTMIKALSMMTVLLLMTACSSEIDDVLTEQPDGKEYVTIPFSATVDGIAGTRATLDGSKHYIFQTGDKLYVEGTGVYGCLTLKAGDEGKRTGATFEGNLNVSGTPAADLTLNAVLVSSTDALHTISGDKVTATAYPTTAIAATEAEAIQKYSDFTGSATYGTPSFTLNQQSAFISFDVTLVDNTATSTAVNVSISNDGGVVRTGSTTTTTVGTDIKAQFVAAFPGGSTTLSDASITLDTRPAISFGGSTALAVNKIYQVNKEYSSLVQHWPFDGDATNAVSGGVDATVSGATLTTDRNGIANSAYYFDGTDDKMEASGAADFGTSSFTANLWVCSTKSSGYGNLLRTDNGYSTNGWLVRFNNGKLEIWEGRSAGRSYVSTNTYSDGLWHMVSYVRDVENHVGKLYVDGSYVGGYTDTDNNVTGPLKFGTFGSGEYYQGKMDDVSLYNRALSASEVAELYPAALSRALSSVTTNEVGWRICDDGNAYSPVGTLPAGVTPVAIIAYVGAAGSVDASNATYKGLAIALTDANGGNSCQWYTSNDGTCTSNQTNDEATVITYKDGIANTTALAGGCEASHTHEAATAAASNNSTPVPTTGTSGWFLPSVGQWNLIVQGLTGGTANLRVNVENETYKASSVNAKIIVAGGTGLKANDYWSCSEWNSEYAWFIRFSEGSVNGYGKNRNTNMFVRSVIAF